VLPLLPLLRVAADAAEFILICIILGIISQQPVFNRRLLVLINITPAAAAAAVGGCAAAPCRLQQPPLRRALGQASPRALASARGHQAAIHAAPAAAAAAARGTAATTIALGLPQGAPFLRLSTLLSSAPSILAAASVTILIIPSLIWQADNLLPRLPGRLNLSNLLATLGPHPAVARGCTDT
jgi:hypothetical protein